MEMKPNTLKGIIDVVNKDYVFRDDTDFILNYFNPVHDNFGISSSGISSLIKKLIRRLNQIRFLMTSMRSLAEKRNESFHLELKLFIG